MTASRTTSVRLWDKATKGRLDYEDRDYHGNGTVG